MFTEYLLYSASRFAAQKLEALPQTIHPHMYTRMYTRSNLTGVMTYDPIYTQTYTQSNLTGMVTYIHADVHAI